MILLVVQIFLLISGSIKSNDVIQSFISEKNVKYHIAFATLLQHLLK